MTTGIKCIVGLGNPGAKYAQTRHNVGFWLVDELARQQGAVFRPESKFHAESCKLSLGGKDCWLLKPMTFMNRSGLAVSALSNFYKIAAQNILVAHDEIDLPSGMVKLKKGGGHGGHNGLRDIISALASKDFYRLRLGVEHPGHRDQVVGYVLGRPSKSDQQLIENAVDDSVRYLPELLNGDFAQVMNSLHQK